MLEIKNITTNNEYSQLKEIYNDSRIRKTFGGYRPDRIIKSSPFLLFLNNAPIGFVLIMFNDDFSVIENIDIGIKQEYSNKGYMKTAIKTIFNKYDLNNIPVEVTINPTNQAVKKIFEEVGLIYLETKKNETKLINDKKRNKLAFRKMISPDDYLHLNKIFNDNKIKLIFGENAIYRTFLGETYLVIYKNIPIGFFIFYFDGDKTIVENVDMGILEQYSKKGYMKTIFKELYEYLNLSTKKVDIEIVGNQDTILTNVGFQKTFKISETGNNIYTNKKDDITP